MEKEDKSKHVEKKRDSDNKNHDDRDKYRDRERRDSRRDDYESRRDRRDDYDDRRERRDNHEDRRDRRDDYDDRRDRRDHNNRRDGQNYRSRDRQDRFHRNRRRRSSSFDHSNAKWGRQDDNDKRNEKKEPSEKQKPNFGLSGKLTEETNTFKGVVVKYSEPPEARKPKRRWRLYPFKGDKALQTLYIHRESAYLIGRDRKVVDLPVDHPSCSKQHAALQYRLVPFTRDDGTMGKRVRPYLIDLESANGTYINNKRIESKKYVELLEKDVVKFGYSSREYVLLHENSKDEALDDDVKQEEVEVKAEPPE